MTAGDRKAREGSGLRLVDLMKLQEEERLAPRMLSRLREYLGWRRVLQAVVYPLNAVRGHLSVLVRAKSFILLVGIAFFAAVGLVVAGFSTLALLPALLGFGLSMATLLYGAFPRLSEGLRRYPQYVSLATWALVTAVFTFVGFSSTLVVFLVLFIGGFTVANVLWGLLPRIIVMFNPLPQEKPRGMTEATGSPLPLLLVFGVIAAWSLAASLIMGHTGIHANRPLGTAFLAAHIGLLLGLIPMGYQMMKEVLRPTVARWHLYRPSKLVRHVLFAMVVSALVGYEVTLASEGSVLAGIPVFAIALVLASYLGALIRQPFSFGSRLRPYHPLVLPAFGMILLFAPLVVLLSSPPVELTRLYGAAQAAGLVLGTILIAVMSLWRERAHRIKVKVQSVVREKLPLDSSKHDESDPYIRIKSRANLTRPTGVKVREAGEGAKKTEEG